MFIEIEGITFYRRYSFKKWAGQKVQRFFRSLMRWSFEFDQVGINGIKVLTIAVLFLGGVCAADNIIEVLHYHSVL